MIAIISNSYEVSKKIIEKLHTEHNQTFCAIEADYGENVINTDCIGVDSFYSHHTLDENYSQPCLAFQEENRDKRNFIISHIDADTIFGIGWLSGIFTKNDKLIEISIMISQMDSFGFHNIDKKLFEKYRKEYEVIMSFISRAKKIIMKTKYKKYYNCTPIIMKTLFNICGVIYNDYNLNSRYDKIIKSREVLKENKLLKESDDYIHVFKKKKNDFNEDSHCFIVIWNVSISVYGRDTKTIHKYIPEGLPKFLNSLFPGSGGHFNAAGTSRNKKVSLLEYKRLILELKKRIVEGSNNG